MKSEKIHEDVRTSVTRRRRAPAATSPVKIINPVRNTKSYLGSLVKRIRQVRERESEREEQNRETKRRRNVRHTTEANKLRKEKRVADKGPSCRRPWFSVFTFKLFFPLVYFSKLDGFMYSRNGMFKHVFFIFLNSYINAVNAFMSHNLRLAFARSQTSQTSFLTFSNVYDGLNVLSHQRC